ncbi:2OG-Fe(II) oxygenase [Metabacillus arenae]|uniref:2OG-Fe(II) oxygenase n=1 Tax=Metabacillus arenae TaxID=2771434 RepID=A0A926RXA1_9BACI|nr:2OG-Fe(II) oxygenase [Metabacillus arenae]MBD1380450.1 2OG-Fe(II) oxygenase [Metabacillus arenae]
MPSMIRERIASLNWDALQRQLDDQGFAKVPVILDQHQCEEIIQTYDEESNFRSTIDMSRYRFGSGEYKYYEAPLPPLLEQLRTNFYPELAKSANLWARQLGKETVFPSNLADFLTECHQKGQVRSTPLILKYGAGGYNCLHQDLYGEVFFPFQVVIALNQRDEDFSGGESLLVEQRPRAQSRGHVITLEQGEGLIFPTNHRPVPGTRGYYKTTIRHGVSTVTSGTRYGLGIIFHDAK